MFCFIKGIYLNDFLGPALKKSQFKNVLIFGNDDQRYSYPTWFQTVRENLNLFIFITDEYSIFNYGNNVFKSNYEIMKIPFKLVS